MAPRGGEDGEDDEFDTANSRHGFSLLSLLMRRSRSSPGLPAPATARREQSSAGGLVKEKKRKRRHEKTDAQIDMERWAEKITTDDENRTNRTVIENPKNARIQGGGLRVHWARFKQRLGTGSALSESLLDGGGESTDSSRSWKRRPGTTYGGGQTDGEGDEEDSEEVDEVVVDNELGSVTQPSEPGSSGTTSEKDKLKSKKSSSHATAESVSGTQHTYGFWESNGFLTFLRWRMWPAIYQFFSLRFMEDTTEQGYRRETWFTSKSLALYSTLFFFVNWFLALGLAVRPFTLADKIFYYGLQPAIIWPLPFLIIYDIPRERPVFYQSFTTITVWSWSIYNTLYMYLCGFYGNKAFTCGKRDFLGLFFYAVGLPTIGMFGLRQMRIVDAIGCMVFFILNAALINPLHPAWTRNILNLLLFHIFLNYIHYKRETSERRLYSLRDQLKVQFRATQKAQVNERKAADSKRRLTSYVFHEVRVPLNTALLAVQNMEASGTIPKDQDIEWAALGGSLSMMSKVLNDVLDFDRLDSGRFSTVKMPYNLHQAIRSMLVPLRLAASARGLTLIVELDRTIDAIAKQARQKDRGEKCNDLFLEGAKTIESVEYGQENLARCDDPRDDDEEDEDPDCLVVGDEMRLRQIITNLASNACKFTRAGGQIKVVTRLVYPQLPLPAEDSASPVVTSAEENGNPAEEANFSKEEKGKIRRNSRRKKPGEGGAKAEGKSRPTPSRTSTGYPFHARPWNSTSPSSPVSPESPSSAQPEGPTTPGSAPLSISHVSRHNSVEELKTLDRIVVRIEVHDTGVGIRPRDLVDNKLFSPYVQTEIGKYQGGKGTGLGLALVRRIVKLSGGRLGVKSKLGVGSTFWVELPLGVGEKAVAEALARPDIPHDGSDYSEGRRERALGLEEIKFFRAVGEGDSPNTAVAAAQEHEGVTPSTLVSNSEHDHLHLNHQQSPASTFIGAPSGRALRSIMDQRGLFEIPAQTKPRPPSAAFNIIPPTPPSSSALRMNDGGEGENEEETSDRHDELNGLTAATRSVSPPPPPLPGPSISAPEMPSAQLHSEGSLAVPPSPPAARKVLPLNEASSTSAGSAPPEVNPPSDLSQQEESQALRVLVVDDDMLTRRLMSRMLTRLGCTVDTAENGKIALDKILAGSPPSGAPTPGVSEYSGPPMFEQSGKENASSLAMQSQWYNYDIVFLDNQMPVMSGLDTVRELRARGRRDLIVGVTGNALISDQQEYTDVGVDKVLTKPVFESSLRTMLAIATHRKQKNEQHLHVSQVHHPS